MQLNNAHSASSPVRFGRAATVSEIRRVAQAVGGESADFNPKLCFIHTGLAEAATDRLAQLFNRVTDHALTDRGFRISRAQYDVADATIDYIDARTKDAGLKLNG
jgi:hypothetical protein